MYDSQNIYNEIKQKKLKMMKHLNFRRTQHVITERKITNYILTIPMYIQMYFKFNVHW